MIRSREEASEGFEDFGHQAESGVVPGRRQVGGLQLVVDE